jgi:hypothetical protein
MSHQFVCFSYSPFPMLRCKGGSSLYFYFLKMWSLRLFLLPTSFFNCLIISKHKQKKYCFSRFRKLARRQNTASSVHGAKMSKHVTRYLHFPPALGLTCPLWQNGSVKYSYNRTVAVLAPGT